MVCCEFGRVLQSVQDSTYESKDDGMMCVRLGEMVHYEGYWMVSCGFEEGLSYSGGYYNPFRIVHMNKKMMGYDVWKAWVV